MKYLVDKYMEHKDWNRKQSGGSIWNSPHYVEIQSASGYGPLLRRFGPPTKLSFKASFVSYLVTNSICKLFVAVLFNHNTIFLN